MVKRGRMMYVPPVIVDEIESMMREHNYPTKADAFKNLVKKDDIDCSKRKKNKHAGIFPGGFFDEE